VSAPAFPKHDAAQWPLRLSITEVAYVWGVSRRTVEGRIKTGRFMPADSDHKWARATVQWFLEQGLQQLDEVASRAQRQAGIAAYPRLVNER